MAETVDHPPHYNAHPAGVECIDVAEAFGFCEGNAIKHLWRADYKGDAATDLRKAIWYLDRAVARAAREPAPPRGAHPLGVDAWTIIRPFPDEIGACLHHIWLARERDHPAWHLELARGHLARHIEAHPAVAAAGGPEVAGGHSDPTGPTTAVDPSRHGDWINVHSGVRFYPLDPRPAEIAIEDIAHALAAVTRFNGHTREPYSVGQHSVLVSRLVADRGASGQEALYGLLHDASEAYIGDVTRPLKRMPEMAGYRAAEARLQAAIYARFGLDGPEPASVQEADHIVLATEARDLLPNIDPEWKARWVDRVPTLPEPIGPWPAPAVEALFLARFRALTEPGDLPREADQCTTP